MFNRLKRALVTSYVGTIALGWLLAQGIVHFANIFSAPVASWLMRKEYSGVLGQASIMRGFSFRDALPELIRSAALLLVGYLLLRWLFFAPLEQPAAETGQEAPKS
jgi:hypothetical protein